MTKAEAKHEMRRIGVMIDSLHRDRRSVVIAAEKGIPAAPGYSLPEIDARLKALMADWDVAHLLTLTREQRKEWVECEEIHALRLERMNLMSACPDDAARSRRAAEINSRLAALNAL